jgi:hypothetical protein
MDLLSDSVGSNPASSIGAISSAFQLLETIMAVFIFPFALLLIALVLYYFTGDKKKAEDFMPKLMAQSFRVFSYFWILIISLVAYMGLNQILNYILSQVLPEGRFSNEVEAETLVRGLVLVLLMAVFAYGYKKLYDYSADVSSVRGSVSTKIFLSFGLIIFSILTFFSSISTFMNFVDFAYDTDGGVSAGSVAMLLSSLTFLSLYLVKGIEILKKEYGKK